MGQGHLADVVLTEHGTEFMRLLWSVTGDGSGQGENGDQVGRRTLARRYVFSASSMMASWCSFDIPLTDSVVRAISSWSIVALPLCTYQVSFAISALHHKLVYEGAGELTSLRPPSHIAGRLCVAQKGSWMSSSSKGRTRGPSSSRCICAPGRCLRRGEKKTRGVSSLEFLSWRAE